MRSSLDSIKLRSDTASRVHAKVLAMQVFEEMLEIRDGCAQLVLDPARRLGLSSAKPSTDLPDLSASRAAYEGFKVVVQGLANMTDDAPWPWKAIPQTILQFIFMAERALDQPRKIRVLTDKIVRRLEFLLSISQRSDGNKTELDICVEVFLADVQRVIIRLRLIERAHPSKALAMTDYIAQVIAGEEEKMQDALQDLQTRFTVHTAYTVETIAAGFAPMQGTTSNTLDLAAGTSADVKDVAATVESTSVTVNATHIMVTQIHAKSTGLNGENASHISNQARLPAVPFCFKGRTALQAKIVKIICESLAAHIAIMGTGGIGKTSLAKAILHDDKVVQLIQDNRFFVPVEDLIDIESAAKRLAEQLGVGETNDPLSAAISALQSLPRSLLILDNLETLWFGNNAAAQKEVEHMLQRLAAIPSLALIVTSRGSVPPSGVQWSNAMSAELEPISLDAARDVFEQIVGQPQRGAEHDALDLLLAGVDCIPLAVTLLAQLAQLKNKPSALLKRWEHTKTAFIRTQGDHRESSVDASIQISFDLLAAMSGGTEGSQLLAICAHLPDGLRPSVFAQLLDQFDDIYAARYLLVAFALVSIGPKDELKMLSPVRHFVVRKYPMTVIHATALRRIYFGIAASGPKGMDDSFSRLAQNVAPEYGNLSSFLLHLIHAEEPSQELFDAVHAISEYSYWTVPSVKLREAFRLRLIAYPKWLVNCLQGIGRTRLARDEYALAKDNFQAALALSKDIGDRFQEADCRLNLGQCLRLQGSLKAAKPELLLAHNTFTELGRDDLAAKCAQQLGNIYHQRLEFDDAVAYVTSARDTFKRHGQRLNVAQSTKNLGKIYLDQNKVNLDQSKLSAAVSELQFALAEFQVIGEENGAAQCAMCLADAWTRQKDYDSAEKLLVTAREAYERIGDRSGLADCHHSFGELYLGQCRVSEARENFEIARSTFASIGHHWGVTACNEEIVKLDNSP
ncbi:hypothetical protein BKA62DRAFT_362394 [Auriculariales sp. MPI-PUGE-AT-0066]|nr:hypothetical protein BKA62DRAFT_362394 [Auriculariales sp. MPI-PUGE-AT-0066]